ncbi:Fc.00g062000.m01.CDS01 [Cosmosporella sp. VM-42]
MAPSKKPTADSRNHEHGTHEASDSDLAQAAAALEANLSNLETKLDAMLAAFEVKASATTGNEGDDEANNGNKSQDDKAKDNDDKNTTT